MAFLWVEPQFNGGDLVIDYSIEMADTYDDDSFEEVASGITETFYL